MQLRNTMFLSLLYIILSSGCTWFNEDVMPMSPLPKVDNQFQLKTVWRCSVGIGSGAFYSNLHPAWQGDRVFAADRRGIVKALDINTGKEIWSTDLSIPEGVFSRNRPAQLSGGLTVVGDKVYLGSELAKVYALNAQDGNVSWKTSVVGEALSTPVVSDGVLLIHTSNGMLQALSEADGTIKWTINLDISPLTLRGESTPTTAFGAVIVGGDNGLVSAMMISNGQFIWQQRISQSRGTTEVARLNDVKATPVVVNGVVYTLAYNGNLTALDLRSGQVIWSREIGSITNILVDSHRIYLVDQDDRVIAVDTRSGIIVWCQINLLHRNLTSPVLYNSYIITGDSEGYLHWISIDDGRFVAQQRVNSSGLLSMPIVANDKLIIQAKNGEIYAFTI